MFYIENACFKGSDEDVKAVIEHFGDLYVGNCNDGSDSIEFTVKRFTNVYKGFPSEKLPLYVLIPSKYLHSVWPRVSMYEDIKYGTSYRTKTPLLVLHLPNKIGLLVCLTPDGDRLEDEDSFGI